MTGPKLRNSEKLVFYLQDNFPKFHKSPDFLTKASFSAGHGRRDAVFSALRKKKKKTQVAVARWLKQLALEEFPTAVDEFFSSPTCLAAPR